MIAGYKKSSLGLIPDDWKEMLIDDISEKIWIGLVTTMTSNYVEDGVKLIRNSDIKQNKVRKEKLIHLDKSFAELHKTRTVKKNDIVTVHTGDIGVSAVIDDYLDGAHGFATLNTRLKKGFNVNFICWFLNSPISIKQAYNFSTGDGRNNLNLKDFVKTLILIPPLPEQQKIAEILSTVDDKIEVIDQQIIETQALKKGLMQRLLTKGIGHTEFKDSPLGMIPKSWEVVELDAVCNVIDPHPSHRAPKEDSNGFPFVGIGDINKNGEINLEKSRKISIKDIEKQKETFTLEENDMGFGRVASIGKVVWFKKQEFPYAISPTMALIKAKKVNPLYCYQFLSSSLVTDQFRMLSVGSTRTSIGMKSLRTLKFLLPSKTEQLQISDILLTMDEKLEVLSEKKTNYQELKQGLMQQLLTGKIRVKV